ncbi:Metabotropic glutamate receptor 3 [Trichoplax sp. H2]|nr:Metabotropic glutamate receptor 3 [Trichoplax sp. H2]|eukprot:RDD38759.1 Metabotropic glutamate receptor 3 [Trichoplax sp. H2]
MKFNLVQYPIYGQLIFLLVQIWPGMSSKDDLSNSMLFPNKTYQPGDVILGGLFDIHDLYDPDSNLCSSINIRGIQYAEAMIYAIQSINDNPNLLPKIKLGYHLLDTCSSSQLALSYAIQYAQPSNKNNQLCSTSSAHGRKENSNKTLTKPIVVIGARTSEQSIAIATLFNQYNLAQVSYASTSRILSNRVHFRTFFRTVPSDIHQAKVFLDLLTYFGWNYIATVAADDIYGQFLVNSVTALASQRGICIPLQRRFSTTKLTTDVKEIIHSLLDDTAIQVIILICSEYQAIQFFKQAEKYNLTGRTFIASDGWGDSPQLKTIRHDVIGGALGVVLDQGLSTDFQYYLQDLDLCNHHNHSKDQDQSWLTSYWRQQLGMDHNMSFHSCQTRQTWLKNNGKTLDSLIADGKSGYVIDSVFATAHALHHALECDDHDCRLDLPLSQLRLKITPSLDNITFDGITDPSFQFDQEGNSQGVYTIINLQPQQDTLNFITIGMWNGSKPIDQELTLFLYQPIVWNSNNSSQIPISTCHGDCQPGSYRRYRKNKSSCCWDCLPCPPNTISNVTNAPVCYSCSWGTFANQSQCQDVQVTHLQISDPLVIALLTVVSFCAIITLLVWICMIIYRRTPIVRATHRLLTHILLFGVIILYIVPILLVLPLTTTICSLVLLILSFSCTCILASIMVKTQLMLGLFNVRNPSAIRQSLLYRTCGQFIIVSVLIIVIVAIVGITLLVYPIEVGRYISTNNLVYANCQATTKAPFIILVVGLFIGNVICISLAYRARKLPSNFNEAKCILVTCVVMCMTLLYLVPFYFATSGLASIAVISFGVTIFAIVVVLCLYSYKIYLIIVRPELNTRHSTRRTVSRYSFSQKTIR